MTNKVPVYHHNGDVTVRIPKRNIENLWNLIRQGRVALARGLPDYDNGFALDFMSILDRKHGNNPYIARDGSYAFGTNQRWPKAKPWNKKINAT